MKKAIILLIVTVLILPGCKFINEKILKKGEDLEMVTEQLKKDLEQAEADHQKELREIKQISQAKIDSIINYYENELASKKPSFGSVGIGTYYLIVGSFKTPEYADNYAFHIMYLDPSSQSDVERFLKETFKVHRGEEIPVKPIRSIKNPPPVWRYFLDTIPSSLSAVGESFVV